MMLRTNFERASLGEKKKMMMKITNLMLLFFVCLLQFLYSFVAGICFFEDVPCLKSLHGSLSFFLFFFLFLLLLFIKRLIFFWSVDTLYESWFVVLVDLSVRLGFDFLFESKSFQPVHHKFVCEFVKLNDVVSRVSLSPHLEFKRSQTENICLEKMSSLFHHIVSILFSVAVLEKNA